MQKQIQTNNLTTLPIFGKTLDYLRGELIKVLTEREALFCQHIEFIHKGQAWKAKFIDEKIFPSTTKKVQELLDKINISLKDEHC